MFFATTEAEDGKDQLWSSAVFSGTFLLVLSEFLFVANEKGCIGEFGDSRRDEELLDGAGVDSLGKEVIDLGLVEVGTIVGEQGAVVECFDIAGQIDKLEVVFFVMPTDGLVVIFNEVSHLLVGAEVEENNLMAIGGERGIVRERDEERWVGRYDGSLGLFVATEEVAFVMPTEIASIVRCLGLPSEGIDMAVDKVVDDAVAEFEYIVGGPGTGSAAEETEEEVPAEDEECENGENREEEDKDCHLQPAKYILIPFHRE